MGSVWRAEDLTLGSPVAVKLIDASLAGDPSVQARFYQEAKAAAALRSPHVVQIFQYGVDEGIPFIAMELLEGESLAQRLARVRILPYAETASIFADVARAARKAHEAGIVHRDLKPENIFLVRNDDQELAKVLDFGIAKTAPLMGAQSHATGTGTLLGTPPYMSPEQARGAKIDHRTDLWALGVIAFECVCGRLPFTADAPGELVLQICAEPIPVPSEVAHVPPGFDAWFARAMARHPSERFQSAKDLADALRLVLTGAVEAMMAVPGAPLPGSSRRAPNGTMHAAPPFDDGVYGRDPRLEPQAPVERVIGAAPPPGTMSGGAAFATGLEPPRRSRLGTRRGTLLGGLALAVVLGAAWRAMGPRSEVPAPSSADVPITDQAAPPPAETALATVLTMGALPPDPGPKAPIVSPGEMAPSPSAALAVTPPATRRSMSKTASGEAASRRVEPAPPAPVPATASPKATAATAPSDKKKPEDRIGF
jgi:serine/threonine-protein kinase